MSQEMEVKSPKSGAHGLTEKELAKLEKKKKKEEEKLAKERKKQEAAEAAKQALEGPKVTVTSLDSANFGKLFIQSSGVSGRPFVCVSSITKEMEGKQVWVRARAQNSRKQGGKLTFMTLRQNLATIQAVASSDVEGLPKFVGGVSKESVVDVLGKVFCPEKPVSSCTQSEVELHLEKCFVTSRAENLPVQIDDLSRSEKELEEAAQKALEKSEAPPARVTLDTRLDNRVLDLRTRTNQSILRIQSGVCRFFRDFLAEKDFVEIHSPKMIATASEGGADVFKLGYFGTDAFLAQSPQLYKQMALMTDLPGVFEIGPVFRSEKSFTHRHMTEFTGLDMEMTFKEHYSEVLDVLDQMFFSMFEGLNQKMKKELEVVKEQYPFQDFKYSYPAKRFKYWEAIKILKAQGVAYLEEDIKKLGEEGKLDAHGLDRLQKLKEHKATIEGLKATDDISTADERLLGRVIHDLYDTDFYMITHFPTANRAFYTMPDAQDPTWSTGYDIFMRGQEIMSGAQRIHDADLLIEKAAKMDPPVDLAPIKDYVDSFRFGAYPHAGGGIGLERVVMLFMDLPNIRLTSMFPRDPKRLRP